MVRLDAATLWCEAQRQSHIEFLKRAHLPIKPLDRAWPQAV
jgi:hypothetical protein